MNTGHLGAALTRLCQQTWDAWRASPNQVLKDYNEEQTLLSGGYADRQILELVQNAADASIGRSAARIEVRVTEASLYASNTGAPLDEPGLQALIFGSLSPKRGEEVGRFGLGFRSLLRLGGTVDFFSAGIGFRFDPAWCASEARKAARLAPESEAPGMRLVTPLDPGAERRSDPILASLDWADTIVRAQLSTQSSRRAMRRELATFPIEFLLFPTANLSLDLLGGEGGDRYLRRIIRGDLRVLDGGGGEEPWHVFVRSFAISDKAAREDAGPLHARKTVRVSWAIPATGRDAPAGRFWNGFPTQTPSVVPGVLDTHWKVNSDRSGLTGHAWNAALMQCAANLVVDSLRSLGTPDDPGRPIGALPRQLDRKDEIAAPLYEAVWRRARRVAFVSCVGGKLHRPDALYRHAVDDTALQAAWSAVAPPVVATQLVHPSCIATRDRASRLEQLARHLADESAGNEGNDADEGIEIDEVGNRPMLRRRAVGDWLEAVRSADLSIAKRVILLAGELVRLLPTRAQAEIRRAYIIPVQDGRLASASNCVMPSADASASGLAAVVHANLASDDAVRHVLTELLTVKDMDDGAWLQALESAWHAYMGSADCEKSWTLLSVAPPHIQQKFFSLHRERIRLKTKDGEWHRCGATLLAGAIVPEDEAAANASVVVDAAFAREYHSVLRYLDVTDVPSDRLVPIPEIESVSILDEPQGAARKRYRELKGASSAHSNTIGYTMWPSILSGLELLGMLAEPSRARLSKLLLLRLSQKEPSNYRVGGRGSRVTQNRYPAIDAPDPSAWLLWKYGSATIGRQTVSLAACFEVERSLTDTERVRIGALLPSKSAIRKHWANGWPGFPAPIEPVWNALLRRHVPDPERLRCLWEAAARRGFTPEAIRDPRTATNLALESVLVVTTEDDRTLAEAARMPHVVLSREAADLWVQRGAVDIRRKIRISQIGEPTEPVHAAVYIPGLADFISDQGPAISLVDRLERVLGRARLSMGLSWESDRLIVSRHWLETTSSHEIMHRLLIAISERQRLTEPVETVLDKLDLSEAERRRAKVAACPDLASRLLCAAGGSIALRQCLPEAASRVIHAQCTDLAIAALCLDVHGPGALRALDETLQRQGLRPPESWGSDQARQFVLALGFPLVFAGAANPRPVAEITVPGPRPLPPLHDYQVAALSELCDLFGAHTNRHRAVLSLPTGAGKTRVAVEMAVRSVLRGQSCRPLVLWVAQTEELAEQAIEAFRHVWAVEGEQATDLRVVRFWGGQRTPSEADDTQPTVVVALIQTLDRRGMWGSSQWLAAASLVIVDESHHGIAPSYTTLLSRVGITTGSRRISSDEKRQREPLLLGLSATPFRSSGEDDSRRLAARFDARVVPQEQHGLYAKLRRDGMLSHVTMKQLEIPEPFSLSPSERVLVDQFGELPESALHRLAGVTVRNEAIVSVIRNSENSAILLFANSVDHAVELAARLSLSGIRSRAVSGATDRSARRDAVSAFKRGEVRVICNAAVFATGFDAPGVDMVLIARPVFSPVRFMQMVGRGLRGPKNGGTEHCVIVTVRDNIEGYADRDPLEWWRRYYE